MKMRATRYATFLLPIIASAQQTSTTSGPCSPIAPNNNGAITIQCGGISSKLANQLIEMMNRIAKDRDPDAIMKKLDDILKGVNEIREAASPREFSKAQHDRLIPLVKQLPEPPSSDVVFDSVVGNAEAQRYGNQLSTALSDALGKSINKPPGLSTCLECIGVWVCVNDNATVKTSNDGKAIREVLELSGVAGAKFCTDPRNGQGTATTIKVLVGPKEPAAPNHAGVNPAELLLQSPDIQERIPDRDLNPTQQQRIAASVCSFGGVNVLISRYGFSTEVRDLAEKINGALPERCAFVVSAASASNVTRGFSGIQVILRLEDTDPRHRAFADAFVAALKVEGLQAVGPVPPPNRGAGVPGPTEFRRVVGVDELTVEIAIGDKP